MVRHWLRRRADELVRFLAASGAPWSGTFGVMWPPVQTVAPAAGVCECDGDRDRVHALSGLSPERLDRRSTAPLTPVELELWGQLTDVVAAPKRGLGRRRS